MSQHTSHCEDREEAIYLHAEGLLGAAEGQRLEAHVAGCVGCRALLRQVVAVNAALEALPAEEPPVEVLQAAMGRVRAARPSWARRLRLPAWLTHPGRPGSLELAPVALVLVVWVCALAWPYLADWKAGLTPLPTSHVAAVGSVETAYQGVVAAPEAVATAGRSLWRAAEGTAARVAEAAVTLLTPTGLVAALAAALALSVFLYLRGPCLVPSPVRR